MKRIAIIPTLSLLVACGGDAGPDSRTAADAAREARESELSDMRDRMSGQGERIAELESSLALARAEARDLRYELDGADDSSEVAPRETVVIGEAEREEGWQEPGMDAEAAESVAPDRPGGRSVLRLYGERPTRPIEEEAALATSTLPLPPLPAGMPTSLPIAPLPGRDAVPPPADVPPFLPPLEQAPDTPRRSAPAPDGAVESYQAALRLVRDRRFDEALPVLDGFLREHPRHAYAPNATYWRGEVYYAQRRYRQAIGQFERVVRRYPRAAKVADSLLKIGLCHLRMGRTARARGYFTRVRRDFPNSVAARLASQEDA